MTKIRTYRFGVFEVDKTAMELRKRGLRLKLAGQPFQILQLLLDKKGEVVTRDELRHAIWPDEAWGDHDQRLNKAMNKLREVLGDTADNPRYIETIPKLGYRFLVPVEIQTIPLVEPETLPQVVAASTKGLSWRWAASFIAVGGVAIGLWLFRPALNPSTEETLVSRPLTTFAGSEHSPNFSPDGKEIVFVWGGEKGSRESIHILETRAGGARRLTSGKAREFAPSFSPDGRMIAFKRENPEGGTSLWVYELVSKQERKVAGLEIDGNSGHLSWTPDGKWLLTAERSSAGNLGIFAISIANGERHQLTQAPADSIGDRSPVISPSGRQLAFTRHTTPEWREVFIADFDPAAIRCRGELRQATSKKLRIDQLAWAEGGKELWFSGATPSGGVSHLSRLILAKQEVRDVAGMRIEGNSFALSPDGKDLAISRRNTESTSLRKIELVSHKNSELLPSQPLLTSTAPDYSPDIAADGEQVVMSSSRSGSPQLWLFRANQNAPKQLTFLGNAGASVPRWSPDAKWVAYESRPDGQSDLFTIEAATGRINRITQTPLQESRANWSRDGKWIYYGCRIDGRLEIFKIPVLGGEATRVTENGGAFAVESVDGKWLYFTSPEPIAEIRRKPIGGGKEETLVTGALGRSALAVGENTIYYLSTPDAVGRTRILAYGAKKITTIAETSNPVHNAIAISPDEKWLIFTELLQPESDIHLLSRQR
jgi:Tol biopolymer transport system component/DNA-binding winged helix-turn-helix (wHTH) protein